MNNLLKEKLANIPHKPGCYLWKDQNNDILYIGKAKDLNKRTHQYFNKAQNAKTQKLVSLINDVDYILVDNEAESLILESNLIKKYKPFYNILLKEGSENFAYIAVTNELNPRILYTKDKLLDAKYYGPFANYKNFNAYELYLFLTRMFPLRKCNRLPNKVCLYYHLKQCLGPCIKTIDQQEYEKIRNQIDEIFNHKATNLIKELEVKEKTYAEALAFEQAQIYYEYSQQLKHIVNEQLVQLKQLNDIDIIGYYEINQILSIMIFNYQNGKLLSKHETICDIHNELEEELMSYLMQYYSQNSIPKQIYVNLNEENIELLASALNTKVIKPQRGTYHDLLTLAIKNAKDYYLKIKLKNDSEYLRTTGALNELKKILNLKQLQTIEMIDNSNTFLEFPVSAVVHFENAHPNKKMYRKYNLKTKINASDVYYMQEVIIRKFSNQDIPIPDLLILDGGVLQVNAVKEVLSTLNLLDKVNIIGLVKNNKHQTEAIIDKDLKTIAIDKHSGVYHLLKNIQDEAHRFAIEFHRKKRDSKISTFLDDIEGLGIKSKQKIIEIYPNLYDLKNANLKTLEQIISKKALNNLILKIKKEL